MKAKDDTECQGVDYRPRCSIGSAHAIRPMFKLAEDDGSLAAIKISSTTSFGGNYSRRSHVVRFHNMLNNPTTMKETLRRQNSAAISRQVSLAMLREKLDFLMVISRQLLRTNQT
jgi:hypothetical protein